MDVNMINVITLAYMGDAVYEVYIREDLIKKGIAKVEDLQKKLLSMYLRKVRLEYLSTYLILVI